MARCWLDLHDPNKTVFLAGCGRSGTTWLGDVLNYRSTFRVLFEPFFPAKVPVLQRAWMPHQYLRPGEAGDKARLARTIVAGRLENEWADQFNAKRFATRRLIKDIRANFMLGWLHEDLPAVPIVFLMRHPIPTVLSQLKMGWKPNFKHFLGQPELMEDFLEPFRAEFDAAREPFAQRLLTWCLLNWVPLRQFAAGGMHVVFYEDLCRRHEEILPPLLAHIGVRHATDGVAHRVSLPSAMTQQFSAIRHGEDPVENWRKQVTPEQIRGALAMLARFGLDRIYGEESLPRVKAEAVPGLFSP